MTQPPPLDSLARDAARILAQDPGRRRRLRAQQQHRRSRPRPDRPAQMESGASRPRRPRRPRRRPRATPVAESRPRVTLRSASIALGRIERDLLTPAERIALYQRAREALDAADAATPIEDAAGRRKLDAANRRYRHVRAARGDIG